MVSKLAGLAMIVGGALALKGSIGFAICHENAEDAYNDRIGRVIAIEEVLEDHGSSEQGISNHTRQIYQNLENELSELKAVPCLMQDKDAYETARNREAWCILAMGVGYTLCIAGKLRENHKP